MFTPFVLLQAENDRKSIYFGSLYNITCNIKMCVCVTNTKIYKSLWKHIISSGAVKSHLISHMELKCHMRYVNTPTDFSIMIAFVYF